jgi:prophage antirepressor-like protein
MEATAEVPSITKTFNDHDIRIVENDGEPWLVAKDVCDALDIGNASMALRRLDDDEKGVNSIETLGGNQEMQLINEAGVYRLIFTSRKTEAEAFKRWLAHDVLPETDAQALILGIPPPECPSTGYW